MNDLKKARIKVHFKYAWPAYVISALIIAGGLSLVFSIVHKLPEYKSLTIFVTGEVTDSKALKEDLLSRYEDKELKSVSTISANPNEGHYHTKLTVPGYSSADVLIISASKLENLDASYFALDLKEELLTSMYSGYTTYKQDEVSYGIRLNKDLVKPYMSLPNEECYMFLNGGSYNIGEYANKPVKEHDTALQLVKYWGM